MYEEFECFLLEALFLPSSDFSEGNEIGHRQLRWRCLTIVNSEVETRELLMLFLTLGSADRRFAEGELVWSCRGHAQDQESSNHLSEGSTIP